MEDECEGVIYYMHFLCVQWAPIQPLTYVGYPSGGFSKSVQKGVKELNFPSILEEAPVFDIYLGIFVDYTCFS